MAWPVTSIPKIILICLACSICSSGNFCGKRYIGGEWKTLGDCPGLSIDDVLRELKEKIEAEKKSENSQVTSCKNVTLEEIPVDLRNETGGEITMQLPVVNSIKVYCDLTTDGGNWTVFQRRMNGNVDFNLTWDDYVNGFGNVRGEFWLGLESIYQLTKNGDQELRIDMIEANTGLYYYAVYSSFKIGPSTEYYSLNVSGYSGNATDALRSQFLPSYGTIQGAQFSTRDNDRDHIESHNCAAEHNGGWWQNACSFTNLNGVYGGERSPSSGIFWILVERRFIRLQYAEIEKSYIQLQYAEMKLRKKR